MEVTTQFSLSLINKPGVLAQVSRQIAQAKVNIIAMTMMDSSEHGVLRLVSNDPEKLKAALSELNLPITETDVLAVTMPNRPGSLADICGKLAQGHVNISYAYCTTGARGGNARGIVKVADTKKAMKVLKEPAPKRRDMKGKLRRPAALR